MATTVTHVVDPDSGSGYDYDSLYDWEAGEQGDLTGVRDEIAVAKCRCTGGTADTTLVVIGGWTGDATRYMKIWTDPSEGYRHNGSYQTGNKYRLEASPTAHLIYFDIEYLRIDGLQLYATGTAEGNNCLAQWSSYNVSLHVSNCILRAVSGNTNGPYGIDFSVDTQTASAWIWNCVFQDFTGYSGVHAGLRVRGANRTVYVYNCTAYNCKNPFYLAGGTAYWTNCGAAASTGTAFTGGTQTTCSDDTPTFVSTAGSYDLHLQSGDTTWQDQGTDLSADANRPFGDTTITKDIDAQTRSGTWDIGADEYVVSTNIKKIAGVLKASVKKVSGVEIASVKKIVGLT